MQFLSTVFSLSIFMYWILFFGTVAVVSNEPLISDEKEWSSLCQKFDTFHFPNCSCSIHRGPQKWLTKIRNRQRNRGNISNKRRRFNNDNLPETNGRQMLYKKAVIENRTDLKQHKTKHDISNANIKTAKNDSDKSFTNKENKAKYNFDKNLNNFFDSEVLHLRNLLQIEDFLPKEVRNQQSLNRNVSENWSLIDKCIEGSNCKRPNCWCMNTAPNFHRKQIPHLIFITFNGVISETMRKRIAFLFSVDRTNPNGCNIRSTVFVTGERSSYGAIHWLHQNGHEIALNGLTADEDIDQQLRSFQIPIQKRLLRIYAGIPEIDIRGWRSPTVDSKIGDHLKYVKQYNLDYDATFSFVERKDNISGQWPFTLDFGFGEAYSSSDVNFREKYYPGLWEVPMTPFIGFKSPSQCLYVDSCRPVTALETYDFLVTNFARAYKTGKRPLGIHLKSGWLQDNQKENFYGLDAFIKLLVDLPDVYIIRISDVIHWIQYPRAIKDGVSLPGLGC